MKLTKSSTAFIYGLFAAAAVLLLGSIIAYRLGDIGVGQLMMKVAEPVCAAAAAVLVNMAFARPRTDEA